MNIYSLVKDCPSFIVVSKSKGIPTLGSSGEVSLFSTLKKDLQRIDKKQKIFAVHRLDKATSGLVLFAKDVRYAKNLEEVFKKRRISKSYQAVVSSDILLFIKNFEKKKYLKKLSDSEFEVTLPIAGEKTKSHIDVDNGRPSYSKVKILKNSKDFSLLEIDIKSGRFHQIRVHLSSLGFPIIGDTLYGGREYERLLLHSCKLSFRDPITNQRWSFKSPSLFQARL